MYSSLDTIWIFICTILSFVAFTGLVMFEIGFVRSKNIGNVVIKSVLNISIVTVCFYLIGFGIMFGKNNILFGWLDIGISKDYTYVLPVSVPVFTYVTYKILCCAVINSLVSSSISERGKLEFYCGLCVIISIFIFPFCNHWINENGWLKNMGFVDYSGVSLISIIGGFASLTATLMIGPRIDKFGIDGRPRLIIGHNFLFSLLGTLVIWIGWIGLVFSFSFPMNSDNINIISHSFINIMFSTSASTLSVAIYTKIKYKKVDIILILNGVLSGLSGISPACTEVTGFGAIVIGVMSAYIMVIFITYFEQKLHIDDSIGSLSFNGVCGIWGLISIGLFSTKSGLIYTGQATLLFVQFIGILAISAWTIVFVYLYYLIYKNFAPVRVNESSELKGLDISEHGFAFGVSNTLHHSTMLLSSNSVPINDSIPIYKNKNTFNGKLTKIEIVISEDRFEILKNTLNNLGVTGMTVTNVLGSGAQKGHSEYVRGMKTEVYLLPKVHVSIVVSNIPIEKIIQSIRTALYTGNIGDGKIFITSIDDVIRIRTGDRGYDALQDGYDYIKNT